MLGAAVPAVTLLYECFFSGFAIFPHWLRQVKFLGILTSKTYNDT